MPNYQNIPSHHDQRDDLYAVDKGRGVFILFCTEHNCKYPWLQLWFRNTDFIQGTEIAATFASREDMDAGECHAFIYDKEAGFPSGTFEGIKWGKDQYLQAEDFVSHYFDAKAYIEKSTIRRARRRSERKKSLDIDLSQFDGFVKDSGHIFDGMEAKTSPLDAIFYEISKDIGGL